MLREIVCEQFHQKRILFNSGLSVVLGTETGDNSIGKSTFLLIVDYVFGGKTYSKSDDILRNVGDHDVFFTFAFDDTEYKFCRNAVDAHYVWCCDSEYNKVSSISLSEYCEWLDDKYKIKLPALSFRDGVGRYIRVYGKKNCIENLPLHYTAEEKSEKACTVLLKLFDKYSSIQLLQAQADKSEKEYTAFTKAQAHQFIAKITKAQRAKNEEEIEELDRQIQEMSDGFEQGLLDVDSEATEQALRIKSMLSQAKRSRSRLKANLKVLDENGAYKFSSTTDDFAYLQQFFPEINIAQIDAIEEFHRKISSIFKAELRIKRKELEKEISDYDLLISDFETELRGLIQNPKLSKTILTRHAELIHSIDRLKKENAAYDKLKILTNNKKEDAERLHEARRTHLSEIAYVMNEEMSRINDAIYEGSYNAPVLDFSETAYSFHTPDDTGTGIAYKGLIVFDLAVLGLTKLPVLVHDSVILKQISDDAIEQIINLYVSSGKQIIIALDKQNSYTEKTEKLLNKCAILKLAPGGSELFGRSWG